MKMVATVASIHHEEEGKRERERETRKREGAKEGERGGNAAGFETRTSGHGGKGGKARI